VKSDPLEEYKAERLKAPQQISEVPPPHKNLKVEIPQTPKEAEVSLVDEQNEELERRYQEQLYYAAREQVAPISKHCTELWSAIFSLLIVVANTLLNALVCYGYWQQDQMGLFIAHVAVYGARGVFAIANDYANKGRWVWFLFELVNLRSIPEFIIYLREWCQHYKDRWVRPTVRHASSFDQAFPLALPIFAIQLYARLFESRFTSARVTFLDAYKWVETAAIAVNAAECLFQSLAFFSYLEVLPNSSTVLEVVEGSANSPTVVPERFNDSPLPYAPPPSLAMTFAFFWKTAYNVGARALLMAVLVNRLGLYSIIPLIGSFVLCVLLVAIKIGRHDSRRRTRDDPLKFASCKFMFGLTSSITIFFTPVPFAPSHSAAEWWLGYILSEVKVIVENIVCAVTLASVYGSDLTTSASVNQEIKQSSDELFYSVVATVGFLLLLNIWGVFILNNEMKERLEKVDYTTESIIDLYSYLFYHLKSSTLGLPALNRTQSFAIPPTPANESILDSQSKRIGKPFVTGRRASLRPTQEVPQDANSSVKAAVPLSTLSIPSPAESIHESPSAIGSGLESVRARNFLISFGDVATPPSRRRSVGGDSTNPIAGNADVCDEQQP